MRARSSVRFRTALPVRGPEPRAAQDPKQNECDSADVPVGRPRNLPDFLALESARPGRELRDVRIARRTAHVEASLQTAKEENFTLGSPMLLKLLVAGPSRVKKIDASPPMTGAIATPRDIRKSRPSCARIIWRPRSDVFLPTSGESHMPRAPDASESHGSTVMYGRAWRSACKPAVAERTLVPEMRLFPSAN